jgi:MFS family permease
LPVRSLQWSVYGLILAGETVWAAVAPLAPTYRHHFGLSATQVGIVLAAATIAILVVSVPAGMVADRIGPRALAVVAGALLVLGTLGHGVATGFATLLAARVVFGVAFGALWTASLTLLASVQTPAQRERSLAASIVIAGVGSSIGPFWGGTLAQRFGLAAPFTGAAVVIVLLTGGLIVSSRHAERGAPVAESVLTGLWRLARQPLARAGLVCMIGAGFVSAAINLLVPLRLADAGFGAGAIGGVFSVSSIAFFAASLIATRLGRRAARIGVGAGFLIGLGALCLIPAASASGTAVVSFALLRAPVVAVLFTISMPLTARGAELVGVGRGVLLGLANTMWAVSATIGPIVAGMCDDHAPRPAAWLLDVFVCVAAGALIARDRRQPLGQRQSGDPGVVLGPLPPG